HRSSSSWPALGHQIAHHIAFPDAGVRPCGAPRRHVRTVPVHLARLVIDEAFEDPDEMTVVHIEREAVFQTTWLGAARIDHRQDMRERLLPLSRRDAHRTRQYDHAASAARRCALAIASSIEPTM